LRFGKRIPKMLLELIPQSAELAELVRWFAAAATEISLTAIRENTGP
jgi:hypothetical protein